MSDKSESVPLFFHLVARSPKRKEGGKMEEYREIISRLDELKKQVEEIHKIVERLDVFKAGTDPSYKMFIQNMKGVQR